MFITGDDTTFTITLPHFDSLSALLSPTLCLRRLIFEEHIPRPPSSLASNWVSHWRYWQKMKGVGEERCDRLVHTPSPSCLTGVGGGEEELLLPSKRKECHRWGNGRRLWPVKLPPFKGETTLDDELITNDHDRLKIKEGKEPRNDLDWISWSGTMVWPSKHILLSVSSSRSVHSTVIWTVDMSWPDVLDSKLRNANLMSPLLYIVSRKPQLPFKICIMEIIIWSLFSVSQVPVLGLSLPCHSVPLALLEAKDSYSPCLREETYGRPG